MSAQEACLLLWVGAGALTGSACPDWPVKTEAQLTRGESYGA